jgi:Ribbon-helix-helix protein, copG family
MSKTTLYLPLDLQHALRAEAKRSGASQAELVREALETFLDTRERPLPRSIGLAVDGSLQGRDSEAWIRATWDPGEDRGGGTQDTAA